MSNLKNPVMLDHPTKYPAFSVSKRMKRSLKRPITATVDCLHANVVNFSDSVFDKKPFCNPLASATKEDSPSMNFPGTTRFLVAQEALEHLERNLETFKKIFEDSHIPTSNYRLLAGFDEDMIRGRLGFLNQIHVFILSEPPDMTSFLSRLLPALEQFSAFVFTDKSMYRLPSALSDFARIARIFTRETAHVLPSSFSTLASNTDAGGPTSLGGPSGQGGNGKDDSTKKDKEREDPERFTPPVLARRERVIQSRNPLDWTVAKPGMPRFRFELPLISISALKLFKTLKPEAHSRLRIPESLALLRFATCNVEFTELLTTSETKLQAPVYHNFQLNVRIDAKDRAYPSKIRPVSTSKYESDLFTFVKPQVTVSASASRTTEQSTSTEKTLNISRIIQTAIGSRSSWAFHIADPFEQEVGLPLPPEMLPFVHLEFWGETQAPPPKYLDIEISSYWSVLGPRGRNTWWSLPTSSPTFSNLCKIITLSLPSDLQGSHFYDADLLVWPKQSENPFMCTSAGKIEGGVKNLVLTKVVETDCKAINPST